LQSSNGKLLQRPRMESEQGVGGRLKPAQTDQTEPIVGIGLPVFNGERYLAQTIDSILAQTFENFELVICDNASTDRTQEIAEGYALRDARVRYYRNDRNLGAGPNYDLCFYRSRGEYFKWAAHDDLLAPDFIAQCVTLLDRNPDAVMSAVGVTHIDSEGRVLRVETFPCSCLASPSPAARFTTTLLNRHGCASCVNFFGVFRRVALLTSQLHGNYGHSDSVLLAEMALRGPSVIVPAPLFFDRDHPGRLTNKGTSPTDMVGWWDQSKTGKREPYILIAYTNLWRLALAAPLPLAERLRAISGLISWWTVRHNFRSAIDQSLWCIAPRVHSLITTLRHKSRQTRQLRESRAALARSAASNECVADQMDHSAHSKV